MILAILIMTTMILVLSIIMTFISLFHFGTTAMLKDEVKKIRGSMDNEDDFSLSKSLMPKRWAEKYARDN